MIEIRKSNIDGRGLFATRDINKGEIVTYYPEHLNIVNNNISFLPSDIIDSMIKVGDFKFLEECHKNSIEPDDLPLLIAKKLKRYVLGTRIGNPYIYDDLKYVGHMINDGAYIAPNITPTEDDIKRYIIGSCMKLNCGLSTDNVIAIRDIKKDEEILTNYGFKYWLDINEKKIDEETKKRCEKFETQRIMSLICYYNGLNK